jgi:quercetin dioxygenase-like cupin family protein
LTTTAKHPVTKPAGEGERYVLGPVAVTIKLSSEDTAGTLAMIEYELPARFQGPPPHVHPAFDEMFYVVEGEVRFQCGDQTIDATAGVTAWCPGNAPHSFSNPTAHQARMVFTLTPGGFEQFFRDVASAGKGAMPDPATMGELSARHGVRPVGVTPDRAAPGA